jgi:hypothetical protein
MGSPRQCASSTCRRSGKKSRPGLAVEKILALKLPDGGQHVSMLWSNSKNEVWTCADCCPCLNVEAIGCSRRMRGSGYGCGVAA